MLKSGPTNGEERKNEREKKDNSLYIAFHDKYTHHLLRTYTNKI